MWGKEWTPTASGGWISDDDAEPLVPIPEDPVEEDDPVEQDNSSEDDDSDDEEDSAEEEDPVDPVDDTLAHTRPLAYPDIGGPSRPPPPHYPEPYWIHHGCPRPVPTLPGDPYFPDFAYEHHMPAKRPRLEPEGDPSRSSEIQQLVQVVTRLCEELQRSRERKGFISSAWEWFRKKF